MMLCETYLLDGVSPGGHCEGLPQLLPELAAPHVHPGEAAVTLDSGYSWLVLYILCSVYA